MGYFSEGAMLARMAEVVARRRRPEDTAKGLLDEMLLDLGLPGAEFTDMEDTPGHPLGDLIAEAFGEGQGYPLLAATNPRRGDGVDRDPVDPDGYDDEATRWGPVRERFAERYGL